MKRFKKETGRGNKIKRWGKAKYSEKKNNDGAKQNYLENTLKH